LKIAIVCGDDLATEEPHQLCRALAAQGEQPTAHVRQSGKRPARSRVGGYRTVAAPVGPPSAVTAPEVLPYVGDWAACLQRAWKSNPPDVVHAYGWLGGLAAQLAARQCQLPTVQSFLGLAAVSHMRTEPATERERVERLLSRSASWVTGESSADVNALARLRRRRYRVSVLMSGVDVEQYTPVGPALASASPRRRVVCLASDPLPDSGFDVVIAAMAKVPDAELILAENGAADSGHDKARDQLRELSHDLGVADRVRIVGSVAADELPMLVRSADVLACTPRQPQRATAVLQAMASGVAVVALPVGVLSDAVIDNVTGLLLAPECSTGLAATLRSLLAQSFRCKSMGSAGRSRAVSRFTWDRIALDALNIYQQLGAESRRGAAGSAAGSGTVVR
jgi:glycosyltransferase involved in cell wall biosynthesis